MKKNSIFQEKKWVKKVDKTLEIKQQAVGKVEWRTKHKKTVKTSSAKSSSWKENHNPSHSVSCLDWVRLYVLGADLFY